MEFVSTHSRWNYILQLARQFTPPFGLGFSPMTQILEYTAFSCSDWWEIVFIG